MPSFLRPDADDATGGWLNETNTTPLYPSVDETVVSDTDLIHSSRDPSADVCRFRLSDPGAALAPPGTLRIRYRREGSGSIDLTVRLKQGTTLIATRTFSSISSSFTTSDIALTTGEYASITDFNDLFVEIQADAGAPAYVGPGDVVSIAAAWWGLRAYSSAKIGTNAIRLRESGGNTEQDFATIAGGGFNLSAISTFKGANNLFVVKMYDQTGNGFDVVQATAANQPSFFLTQIGSLPSVQFVGASSAKLLSATGCSLSAPVSFSGVAKYESAGFVTAVGNYDAGSGDRVQLQFQGGSAITDISGNRTTSTPATISTWHALAGGSLTFSSAFVSLNGTVTTVNPSIIAGTHSYTLALGTRGDGNEQFVDGWINEGGFWNTGFSSGDCASLSSNQRAYWGIDPTGYTGPGDTVSGASGWWGLRAYKAAAIGSRSVRLRRDSDNAEQDFVTLTGGLLDTTAITAFKGAANLFVSKIYDQTGGGFGDLAQATAAKQPALILSGIGSKPVLRFVRASSQVLGTTTSTANIPQVWSISATAKRTGSFTSNCSIMGDEGTNAQIGMANATDTAFCYPAGGSFSQFGTALDNVMHSLVGVGNGTSTEINVDGNSFTGGAATGTGLVNQPSFGGYQAGGNYFDGDGMEMGIWPIGFSGAQSTAMSSNQHTYWGF